MIDRIRAGKLIGGGVAAVAAAGLVSVAALAGNGGSSSASSSSSSSSMPAGEHIAKGSDCFSCHAVDHKVVGPAFRTIARKFAGKQGAESTLAHAIQHGEVGTFGQVPMPAHPKISDSQTKQIVAWILSLKSGSSSAGKTAQKTYTYTINGKTVTTDFPIFKQGSKSKVTKDVFRGYELFNSYCYRCHGEDAVGGEYAPDLRRSLNNGMSEAKFRQIAMTGAKAKGMPAWAGFFSPHQINVIYQYVKARAVGAVGTGTPNE